MMRQNNIQSGVSLKINVIKDEGKELIVEFDTKDFTIPDMIADQLLEDGSVEYAGVMKEYRETSSPRLMITAKKPKDSLAKAVSELEDEFAAIAKQAKK